MLTKNILVNKHVRENVRESLESIVVESRLGNQLLILGNAIDYLRYRNSEYIYIYIYIYIYMFYIYIYMFYIYIYMYIYMFYIYIYIYVFIK